MGLKTDVPLGESMKLGQGRKFRARSLGLGSRLAFGSASKVFEAQTFVRIAAKLRLFSSYILDMSEYIPKKQSPH